MRATPTAPESRRSRLTLGRRQRVKRSRAARWRRSAELGSWSKVMVALALIFGVWALTASRTEEFVMPGPVAIAEELWTDPQLYLDQARTTAIEAGAGFFLGTLIAIVASALFLFSRTLRQSLYPVAVAVNSVPIVAISPLLIIALGSGIGTKIVITTLISYFPTLIAMTRGLTAVEPEAVEYFRTLHVGPIRTLFLLRWPSSLPHLFVGLRIAASSCVISAVIAEWVGAEAGLGYLIILSSRQFEILTMWSSVVSATLLALLGFGLVLLAERWALRGRPAVT